MGSDNKEINKSAYEVYSNMEEEFHNVQSNLNDKSIEIVKINLLVGGIIATIVSIEPENIVLPYFIVGFFTLLLSMWFCVNVYSQTKTYTIGVGTDKLEKMLKENDSGEHYRKLSISYRDNITRFKDTYNDERTDFETGLWTAYVTIFLFILGAGRTILSSTASIDVHVTIDVVIIVSTLFFLGRRIMYLQYSD